MAEPLVPPIVASATFRFQTNAEVLRAVGGEGPLYSRWDNPTVQAMEEAVRARIGAEGALAFGSGMAAISTALIVALEDRKLLLCQEQVYGGTYELARSLLVRLGAEVRFVPADAWDAALDRPDAARAVVYVETPTNPTLEVVDIERIAARTRDLGGLLLVDNTFATPVLQSTLELGADVELHSATKYLGGHHDLLAGIVAGSKEFTQRAWQARKLLGGVLDPFQAFLLHRGLRTLDLRVERQSTTALAIARWLEDQAPVSRVHYPGLEGHPRHAVAKRQMRAFGGMLAFEIAEGDAAARRFSEALEDIALAPSLGGTETLITLPATTTHVSLSDEERAQSGLAPGLVRLSVGLEPFETLRDDLARALAAPGSGA
jgi:cystathionine beta-lyase/cystathionine gamma-synthase